MPSFLLWITIIVKGLHIWFYLGIFRNGKREQSWQFFWISQLPWYLHMHVTDRTSGLETNRNSIGSFSRNSDLFGVETFFLNTTYVFQKSSVIDSPERMPFILTCLSGPFCIVPGGRSVWRSRDGSGNCCRRKCPWDQNIKSKSQSFILSCRNGCE